MKSTGNPTTDDADDTDRKCRSQIHPCHPRHPWSISRSPAATDWFVSPLVGAELLRGFSSLHASMEVLVTRAYKRHGDQRAAALDTCAVVFLRSL
jgi:hypothetical protein